MSNTTSVVSSAEGPSIQEEADKITVEELGSDTVATYNPNLAETREVVIEYNKESDENSGDGTRAMRRQGDTVGPFHGVKRDAANITMVRENSKAADGVAIKGQTWRCVYRGQCASWRRPSVQPGGAGGWRLALSLQYLPEIWAGVPMDGGWAICGSASGVRSRITDHVPSIPPMPPPRPFLLPQTWELNTTGGI
jgi:hypothetical protein